MTKRKTKGKPNRLDVIIGQNLKLLRLACGMSQQKLANRVGLTFQQVQKYEQALNRVSASKLYELAQVFQVPVSRFYHGLDPAGTNGPLLTFSFKDIELMKALNADENKDLKALVRRMIKQNP